MSLGLSPRRLVSAHPVRSGSNPVEPPLGWTEHILTLRLDWAPVAFVLLLIASPYLLSVSRFGSLEYRDYYWILGQIANGSGFSTNPLTWLLVKSNEHTVTLPALIYVLNIWLTGGDNRALSALSLALMTAVFIILYRFVPSERRRGTVAKIAVTLTIGPFVFTPAAAHNVVMGFSGTLWFLSNVFAVAAVAALVRRSRGGRLYPTLVFGTLGALSYSTSLFVWPALLVGCLLLRLSRRDFVGLSATACVLFLLSAVLYVRPEGHPEPQTRDVMLLFRYSGGYLGALFSSDSRVASYFGLSGLLVSAAVATAAVRRGEEARLRAAPWIMVQCYAIANAGATAVFRSGLAAGPGESRYATLPALFWAALLMMSFLAMSEDGQPGRSTGVLRWSPAGMLVFSLVVPMYGRGIEVLRGFLERAAYAPVASQALLLGIHDDVMLNYVTYYPEEIWSVLPVLQRTRHVPFNHPTQATLPVAVWLQPESPEVAGYFDTLDRIDDHFARACGWAFGLKDVVVEVTIADDTGAVRGRGVLGLPREDVGRQLGAAATASGWCGYVHIDGPSQSYTAYARRAGGQTSFALIGVHKAS